MTEIERLEQEVATLKAQRAELESRVRHIAEQNAAMLERLTLSDAERLVLAGRDDGCVRIGELQPILRRVFG